jgi:hypothetical protein
MPLRGVCLETAIVLSGVLRSSEVQDVSRPALRPREVGQDLGMIGRVIGVVSGQGRTTRDTQEMAGKQSNSKLSRERATRIELAFSAWEADVLPLNYARGMPLSVAKPGGEVHSLDSQEGCSSLGGHLMFNGLPATAIGGATESEWFQTSTRN